MLYLGYIFRAEQKNKLMKTFKLTLRLAFFLCFVIALLLFALARVNARLARRIDELIAAPVRNFLYGSTSLLSVPIFEIMLISLPVLLLILALRGRAFAVSAVAILLVVCFVACIGIPSSINGIEQGTEREVDYISALATVCRVLDEVCRNGNVEDLHINGAKESLFPSVLTKMGILGYYAFPTGEIVLNQTQPRAMLCFTLAHEMAHLSGVSAEDEANLAAFRKLSLSPYPCEIFSGYFAAFCYLAAPAYAKDAAKYARLYDGLPQEVLTSLAQRREFLAKGEGGGLRYASDKLNDVALSALDGRGAAAYSKTSALIAEYILSAEYTQ